MIYTPLTKKAMQLMFEKHKNQIDKAGIPYVFHPMHVAEGMKDEYTTIVGLLHDVVEDTDVTFEQLSEMGFPEEVIEALRCLTHDKNVDYYDYVKKVGENPIARPVKIRDLEHNSDLTRLEEITPEDLEREEKYKRCIEYLKDLEYLEEHNKTL